MKKNNWEQSACTRFKDIYRWIVVLATNPVAFKFLELLKYHRCKVAGFAGSCSRICWLVLLESVGSFPINMLHQEVKTENVAFLALSAPWFLNICFTQQILHTIRQKKLLLRVNKCLKLYRFITFFPPWFHSVGVSGVHGSTYCGCYLDESVFLWVQWWGFN